MQTTHSDILAMAHFLLENKITFDKLSAWQPDAAFKTQARLNYTSKTELHKQI